MFRVNGREQGLSGREVEESREKNGANELARKKRRSFLSSLLESFGDPMIRILLVALLVNVIFLFNHSGWLESAGIAIAVLLATVVSTACEYGSESAFERLQEEAGAAVCRVRRDGSVREIPSREIVVGDLILLGPGDRVPADGVIVRGAASVDQSALNGEEKEADKTPGKSRTRPASELLDTERLFSGSVVCSGECEMIARKVGSSTFFGQVSQEVQQETRESPLRLRLGHLAGTIGKIGYVAAALTAGAYFFNAIVLASGFDPVKMAGIVKDPALMLGHVAKAATLAVSVIVMAVPEGLPMMITVVLSSNMRRMLRDGVLVRKLVGIETSGSLNILFTDKTGTLTRGRLTAAAFISPQGREWDAAGILSEPVKLREIVFTSLAGNSSSECDETGRAVGGNATDRAVTEFASQFPLRRPSLQAVARIPFSSDTKFSACQVSGEWSGILAKGAPEVILARCRAAFDENGIVRPLDSSAVEEAASRYAQKSYRLLALATGSGAIERGRTPSDLVLVGLLAMRDELRAEAVAGVREVKGAGVQTVMITGDAPQTARAIATDAGILDDPSNLVLTSSDLAGLDDGVLAKLLPDLRVVARALPSDKSRLVRVAQSRGLTVGMTGDGVNDAPALKQADVGFAMGSGTEVAKDAGDIVILDDNFASIANAIRYGRTIFKSIRKFIIYQMSICLCAVIVTVLGQFIGIETPITVIQMLWLNIVMDTLAGLAFSGEKPRAKYMTEPPKRRDEPILNAYMTGQILVDGTYAAAACLVFQKSPLVDPGGGIAAMTEFYAAFMFIAIFLSFCARTHSTNLAEYLAANKPFILIMGAVCAIQLSILYFGGTAFRTSPLPARDLLTALALACTVFPVDHARKLVVGALNGGTGT